MNEIKYFSMFTGVGGFELGLENSRGKSYLSRGWNENSRGTQSIQDNRDKSSNETTLFTCVGNETEGGGDGRSDCEEENPHNTERNKPIPQRQQEHNNSTNNRDIRNTENPDGTLFQNGQLQGNTVSRDMEEVEGDTKFRQQIRQGSDGVLREGSRIRDDSESLRQQEDKPNTSKFRCVGMSEFNKYSSELLAKRFPTIKNWGDCTKINPRELPDFDMLCGGFPCQAFSIAGKRKGFEDIRGTMFFEVARILEVKRPKIVFLENVKGLLNHNKGETFRVILQTLDELGYEVQWMVLNSKFHGVPQNRERVFIIGSLRGTSRPEILPFREDVQEPYDKDSEICQCIPGRYYKGGNGTHIKTILDLYNKKEHQDRSPALTEPHHNTIRVKERFPLRFPSRNQKNIEGDYAFTVDASNTGGIREGIQIRKLTPTECERLQGFPDGWTEGFSDTQRYKMMGNAVTVNVIKAIAEKMEVRDEC